MTWEIETVVELGSSSVQTKLKAVDTVYSNKTAFVAKLTDSSVVTWGFVGDGGDSSSVQGELKN